MALIKCPECGENISSIAEKCVHCGCVLTVCPDCGKTYAGETEVCSSCGFNFKKSNERKTGKAFKGILDYWGAINPGDRLLSKLIPIILAVIGVGFIAFTIMSVTNVIRLGYNTDNTKIFKIGVSVNVAVIFAVVFFVMLIATSILHSAFIPFKCGAWIRENEIDVTPFTARLKELPRSKRTSKNNREIRSAYVSEYPRELSKTVKISSVCGIFYIVCFIIACVFLNEGIESFIVKKSFVSPETALIASIDWMLLLIPGIIIALTLAVDILFRVLLRRKVGAWLGYPEAKEADLTKKPETNPTENTDVSSTEKIATNPTENTDVSSTEKAETNPTKPMENSEAKSETRLADTAEAPLSGGLNNNLKMTSETAHENETKITEATVEETEKTEDISETVEEAGVGSEDTAETEGATETTEETDSKNPPALENEETPETTPESDE